KRIASISTEYDMTAVNGAYRSEQRSYIYSPELSAGESAVVNGVGTGGTMVYANRSLDFAIGATEPTITFELRAFRTWTSSGQSTDCSEYNNKVDDDTDRKSTRLNSSHVKISYAVFCLKKKKK